MRCVSSSVSYLGKSAALAGCAKMIYRLPRWRKDFDALNDPQIFDSCEHAHDLEVNIDCRTSLYGVCYHAVLFFLNGFFFRKFHCFMEWCIVAKHTGVLIIMIMDESRIDLYQFLDHCQIWILKPPAIHQPPRLLWLGSRYQRRFSRFKKGDGIKIWQVESCFLWWMVPALMAGWYSLTFMI